ncbi:MAG: DegT/DnrJ/EryC1/StrS aminotransferase family protein [Deltaproteobacteria bacterium]|nr:DegT/DnrJ/EryC1/StrS aminotransferase family protein [Deltaproteobacteria bacterium]
MNKTIIPHNRPTLGKIEIETSRRVLESQLLCGGEEIPLFEKEFCEFLKLPEGHALAVSSGSAALYLALLVLEAKGKKVSFPTYVCSSLKQAVRLANAEAVILDTAPSSPHIDLEQAEKSAAEIVIIPHLYGIPCDFQKVSSKLIIEDCAQALGASLQDKALGSIGEIGIFSFYATKLMTSGGQGGMIVSKNKKYINTLRDYIYFDNKNDNQDRFNFQMTELQAAIGRAQLERLPDFLKKREEIFQKYSSLGLDLIGKELPQSGQSSVRYRAVWKTKDAIQWKEKLFSLGIKTIIPIEQQELLGPAHLFPNANELCQNTLSLPLYPSLSDRELEQILGALQS